MAYPVTLDPITGRSGQTLDISLTWKEGGVPVNLTGWSALLQVRVNADSPVLAELASADGEIALGGAAGTILASFTEAHTTAIGAGSFKWDLRLESAGGADVVYLAEGALKFKKPISREA